MDNNVKEANIDSFVDQVIIQLLEKAEQEEIAHDAAWPILAAELLGYDVSEIDFFTNRDTGIDFFVESSSIYEIFQAKMHELGEFFESKHQVSFDDRGIRDLERARSFLLDNKTPPPNVDKRLLGLRERLRDDISMTLDSDVFDESSHITIIFHLVTFGDNLAPRAEHAIQQFKVDLAQYGQKYPNVELLFEHHGLKSLSQFYEVESTEKRPEKITLQLASKQLGFKSPSEVEIRSNKFVTFYASASDLVKASHRYGPRLFDANVRYELKRSAINPLITKSATHEKTIKLFHLYNNGVTIAGHGWAYKKKGQEIEIRQPSVINGCQTVRSLAEAQKQLESSSDSHPKLLEDFKEKCCVLVRLVNHDSVQIEDIVRAANTQNAMEPRNLLSNQPEQRRLESKFATLGWFFERKDGAQDALKESKRSALGHHISMFQVKKRTRGQKKLRACSNKEVAAAWLSFIGYSDEGQNKKTKHFNESRDGLYKKIFEQTPVAHRHILTLEGNNDEAFKVTHPPASWMLITYLIFKIIRHLIPSAKQIRGQLRKEMGTLGEPLTLAKVNKRIMNDDFLRLSYTLSVADHILLEVVGYIIARALGDAWLMPGPARNLFKLGTLNSFYELNQAPESLDLNSLLQLSKEQTSKDPILLALRFAAYGIEKTLNDPIEKQAFIRSERKSRYIQNEGLLRKYPKTIEMYEKHFSQPANFTDWWDEGSIYARIKNLLC